MKKSLLIILFIPLLIQAQEKIETSTRMETELKKEVSEASEVLFTIPKNSDVQVIDFVNKYWKIKYLDTEGFVRFNSLYKNGTMYDMVKNEEYNGLKVKYGAEIARKIQNQNVWIGMTRKMLIDSQGLPKDKNISRGSWGKKEQWVYGNKYVYIEEGEVTAIQRSY